VSLFERFNIMNSEQEQMERRQRHIREEMERRRRHEKLQDEARRQRERYEDKSRQDRFHRETLAAEKRNIQSITNESKHESIDSSSISSKSSFLNDALTPDEIETDVEQIKEALQNFVRTGLICVPIIGALYVLSLFLDGPLIKPAIFMVALFPGFYILIAAWNIMAILVKITFYILFANGIIYLVWWGLGIPGLEYISLPLRWIFGL
jgi:hypothetical protein